MVTVYLGDSASVMSLDLVTGSAQTLGLFLCLQTVLQQEYTEYNDDDNDEEAENSVNDFISQVSG